MGKAERIKGHNFEREISRQIRDIFPESRRGLQYQDGSKHSDVEGTPFHIECKCGKKQNPRKALRQAISDNKKGRMPIAVIRDDRKPAFVCMLWEDFKELVKEWKERGEL